MIMKVAILSTPTKHHTYFINKLAQRFDVCTLIYETRKHVAAFPTGPFFAQEEDDFENRFFDAAYSGTKDRIPAAIEEMKITVRSVNDQMAIERLRTDQPDVIILFGVGKVNAEVFSLARWGAVNVHRGITQYYRGLDADLWAIFDNRFDQIGVTLHYVDETFDTGKILSQKTVNIGPDDKIYHIRYITSVCATNMMVDLLSTFERNSGPLPGQALNPKGAYFSAMPLEKKHQAHKNFESYCKTLEV